MLANQKEIEVLFDIRFWYSNLCPPNLGISLASEDTIYGIETPRWVQQTLGGRISGGVLHPYDKSKHIFVHESEIEYISGKSYFPEDDTLLEIISPTQNLAYSIPIVKNRENGIFHRVWIAGHYIETEKGRKPYGGGTTVQQMVNESTSVGSEIRYVSNWPEKDTKYVDIIEEPTGGQFGFIKTRRIFPVLRKDPEIRLLDHSEKYRMMRWFPHSVASRLIDLRQTAHDSVNNLRLFGEGGRVVLAHNYLDFSVADLVANNSEKNKLSLILMANYPFKKFEEKRRILKNFFGN